jgi:putative Mn2+ efflux pump MntP
MVKKTKTWVFWLGLLIFAGACFELFSTIWTYYAYPYDYGNFAKATVSPIVGGVIFILVGLYMMWSGRKETGSPVETKPV